MRKNSMSIELDTFEQKAKSIWLKIAIGGFVLLYFAFWALNGIGFIFYLYKEYALLSIIWAVLCLHKYFLTISAKDFDRIKAVRSGYSGELKALDIFTRLDGFHAFQQVLIPNKRSRTNTTEADIILVGRGALFVVEVKNISGKVYMDSVSDQWKTQRISGNSTINGSMRNPVNQVLYQKKMLEAAIERRYIGEVPVRALVYFTSDNLMLMKKNNDEMLVPVYRNPIQGMLDDLVMIDSEYLEFEDRDYILDLIDEIADEGASVFKPFS